MIILTPICPQDMGLNKVSYFASKLNLFPKYFGDLLKKVIGKSVQDQSKSIIVIAYEIGFKFPQHFTRLFKRNVGQTPMTYKMFK